MPLARGWAVVDGGEIVVESVSPTRSGAIINWLFTARQILVTRTHTDEEIQDNWLAFRGNAEVVPVGIVAWDQHEPISLAVRTASGPSQRTAPQAASPLPATSRRTGNTDS